MCELHSGFLVLRPVAGLGKALQSQGKGGGARGLAGASRLPSSCTP